MTQQLKLGAYAVLLVLALWFGYGFVKNLRAANAAAAPDANAPAQAAAPPETNRTDIAEGGITNEATNSISTNVAGADLGNTNAGTAAKPATPPSGKSQQPRPVVTRGEHTSRAMSWGAGLFGVIVCLGLLIAHDFSHFAANRIQKFVFDEDLEGGKDPEYEEAEKVWANGNHLEAIQLMRDYLKAHPREQYVAIRIAEIYEKDLANYLAAALEYEEILKKKLPAQRWGWAAIHLANLYSGKLNRGQDAILILQRIVAEYGHTAAAKKARERLMAEGIAVPEPVLEPAVADEPEEKPPVPPSEPPSNLPPGFKPKK